MSKLGTAEASKPEMPQSNTSAASLTCLQTLWPPLLTVGAPDNDGNALTYRSTAPCWSVCYHRHGQYIAAAYGAPDPCIRIWSCCGTTTSNNQPWWTLHATLRLHERAVRSVAFAPTSSPITLASASFDGTIAIWELDVSGMLVQEDTNDDDDHTDAWECVAQLEGHESEVKCVCWNGTGTLLATCGRDKSVWIWECFLPGTVGGARNDAGGDFECLTILSGHEGDVKCVVFGPSHGQFGDGDEILLSASYDDSIKVWAEDAGDWYCAATIAGVHKSTVWSLALSPSGGRLISGGADGMLAIYKAYSHADKKQRFPNEAVAHDMNGIWKCVGTLPNAHDDDAAVYSVDYASAKCGHGRLVSAGGDNTIQVYREEIGSSSDTPIFSVEAKATGTHGDVNAVRWHPWDGSWLASAGDDGAVRIWEYRGGE